MRHWVARCAVFLLALVAVSRVGAQDHSAGPARLARPNDFSAEMLGRSILYTVSYSRMLTQAIGLEAGAGVFTGTAPDTSTIITVPVGAKFYLTPSNNSLYLAGGAVFVSATLQRGPFQDAPGKSVYGYAGLGFEHRAIGGFVLRVTAYELFSGGAAHIWPAFSVGHSF